MKTYKCCICDKTFEGYSNNALPFADGECCDECNQKYVIPYRMLLATTNSEK